MFEIVPGIPIIILKQPPPPIVPLPHLLKAVKLGSEPKNRKIALKGRLFQLPATAPKQKSRLKRKLDLKVPATFVLHSLHKCANSWSRIPWKFVNLCTNYAKFRDAISSKFDHFSVFSRGSPLWGAHQRWRSENQALLPSFSRISSKKEGIFWRKTLFLEKLADLTRKRREFFAAIFCIFEKFGEFFKFWISLFK